MSLAFSPTTFRASVPVAKCGERLTAMHQAFPAMHQAAKELGACIGLDRPEEIIRLEPGWIEALLEQTARWKANVIKAPQWATWRGAAKTARHAGLSPLVDAVEDGTVTGDEIAGAFDYAYARWVAETIVNDDEVLSGFLAEKHEAAIEAFVAADTKVGELARQIVKARIGAAVPTQTNFGKDPEWGTLAREINKKARHMPLRQLFGRIPNVMTQLAPCVMMSPLSIAQYLPADAKPFDVVIFDEASQIPVWDAIGAIARGTQVIIVGDPEQLPPTSVGQRGVDDEDDDGSTVQSQQSILDECLASNIPSMRLSWHYRSRHESLIAFSNAKYYRGELMTFPSPVTRDTAVRYVHVEGGIYERGGAKVNRKEAEAVVAEVVKRMKTSTQSIGVVTFNGDQQRLIENMLDQARRSDPALETHFDKNQTREPILVKNIENVQGDERDVIIFSVAVGPDKTGRITAQISSLNGEGGHRRLNVAVTRARSELLVFATLRPEQIDLGRTVCQGRRRLQAFPRICRARRACHRGSLLADRPRHGIAVRGCRNEGARGQGMGDPPPSWRVFLPDRPRRRASGFPRSLPRRRRMRRRYLSPLSHRSRSRPTARDGTQWSRLEDPAHLEHRMVDGRGVRDR